MTTYSTGNPVGSPDPRDLYDNAENLDNAANSDNTTWTDRLGQSRRTLAGMENEFQGDQEQRADEFDAAQDGRQAQFAQLMISGGYTGTGADGAIEEYASDITVSTYKEIISDGGEFWRAAADTTLPYTTTGAGMPEGGAFVNVGDGVLRQDLVQPVATFNNVADMKAATGLDVGRKARTLGYYTPGDGGGNDYEIVAAGTGSNYGFLFEQLTASGHEAKLLGGGIMEDKVVHLPDDIPSYQDALDMLSGLSFIGGSTITLLGRSGWEIEDGVYLFGGDYSRFRIEHEDPIAYVSDTFPASRNLFGIYSGATGPIISCLFDMKGLGNDAFNVNGASKLVIEDDAGVTNAGRTAIFSFNGSIVDAADSVVTNSKGRTIWASGGAIVNAQNSNLSGGNSDYLSTDFTGAITSRRASVVNIQGSDISNSGGLAIYCIRASALNANNCTCNGGENVIISQSGGVVSAQFLSVSNITGYLASAEGYGKIDASDSTLDGASRGLLADKYSEINASSISLVGISGSSDRAISAANGSTIWADDATISNFSLPFRAVFDSKIISNNSNVSGNEKLAFALSSSKISIRGVTSLEITGKGVEAENFSEVFCQNASIESLSDSNFGINATGASTIDASGASVSGFDAPLRVFSGSKIYAIESDLTGNLSRSSIAGGFSQIWALNATTKNSTTAGEPNIDDFSVSSFNSIFGPGAVWA